VAYTLLLGGARSGKSTLAVKLAGSYRGGVTVLATAEAGDEEMADRIERHRRSRPSEWRVVEEPLRVAQAAAEAEGLLLLDCLTLWVSNLTGAGWSSQAVLDEAGALARVLAGRTEPAVVVSNEVGWGIVPASAEVRAWRDLMGSVNQVVAASAEKVMLVVAGRVVELEPGDG
jgi:adenosyl cobinamide kinase/adenosyl cobinamide phosphate guanylyltransferase